MVPFDAGNGVSRKIFRGCQRKKQDRKIAPLSLPLLYQVHVWKSRGHGFFCPRPWKRGLFEPWDPPLNPPLILLNSDWDVEAPGINLILFFVRRFSDLFRFGIINCFFERSKYNIIVSYISCTPYHVNILCKCTSAGSGDIIPPIKN